MYALVKVVHLRQILLLLFFFISNSTRITLWLRFFYACLCFRFLWSVGWHLYALLFDRFYSLGSFGMAFIVLLGYLLSRSLVFCFIYGCCAHLQLNGCFASISLILCRKWLFFVWMTFLAITRWNVTWMEWELCLRRYAIQPFFGPAWKTLY